jgi:hypothetical protein
MRKFLKIKKFFQKTCKKFPAAAEGRKKLKIFSRRRRERRRLTPLDVCDVRRLETGVEDPDETEDARDNERRVDEASIFKSYKMKRGSQKKKSNRNRT